MIVTKVERLEIDGIPTCTPAWETVDIQEFWAAADPKGSDRELAGDAVIVNPRSSAPSQRMAPMKFDGRWDPDGIEHPDRRIGAWANYRLFKDLCVGPSDASDTAREILLYGPDGSVLVGRGHVLGPFLPTAPGPWILRATLVVDLPDGELVELEEES